MEFQWIQICLVLIALPQFTAAQAKTLYLTIRDGDDVTLPCENLIANQINCEGTDWRFDDSPNAASILLFRQGRIGKYAGSKSGRLSVTEDCHLHIKRVSLEDVGHYLCQQFNPGRMHDSNALVDLSVVTMTKQRGSDSVTFSGSVWAPDQSTCRVKWLSGGEVVSEHHQGFRTPDRLCFSSAVFQTNHHFMNKSRSNSLQCEVTVDTSVLLFPFRPQPSGQHARTTNIITTTESSFETGITTTKSAICNGPANLHDDFCGPSVLDWIMLSLRVSELVLITVITVLLFRASGNHRPPDDFTVSYDGEEVTVTYENVEEPSASGRHH
ncbi:uncharacterized protein LOC117824562 [Xyrichtys novacula]|uniref:Uncharacterized protein LOC117824562 n=1 Tax=Xyrichtys novacula TaxID=13765 RepID=A0AAV1GVR5_XYRNO|nr:uncharacterized protein LOC117824562 [Xyrichtys novacula]